MTDPTAPPTYEFGVWGGLSRRLSPYLDPAIGVVAAGLAVTSLLTSDMARLDPRLQPPNALAVIATLIAGLSLVWRRRHPPLAFTVFLAASLAVSLSDHFIGLLSMLLLFSLYSLAAHGRGRAGVIGLLVAVAGFVVLAILDVPDLRTSDLLLATALLVAAWAVGDAIRSRRAEQAERLRAARQEAAAAREQAARAVVEERLRIARELHDLVAHSMALIAVQAGVGGHLIRSDLTAAEHTLEVIAATSREALTQTRSMLGVLREQDPDLMGAPAHCVDDLDTMVHDLLESGLHVLLSVEGIRRTLEPEVELTVYRVVQESLTNVLRHSGATRAEVGLTYGEDAVDIEVRDSGRGGRRQLAAPATGGHGLLGLRERARLLGGALEFGAYGAGFQVTAHLPSPAVAAL
jgi:signal transduction histidine kinase